MTDKEKEYYLELYKKERELLFLSKLEQSKLFDKYIFTISSLSLGLSLTLIKDILKNPECKILLIVSWILFFISVVSSLLSFYFSQKAIDEYLEILNKYILSLLIENRYTEIEENSRYSNFVEILNFVSLFFLSLGLLILLVFFILNII